jgi:hypothetical protein
LIIVIDFDVFKDLAASLRFGSEAVLEWKAFGLEATKERLGEILSKVVYGAAHPWFKTD